MELEKALKRPYNPTGRVKKILKEQMPDPKKSSLYNRKYLAEKYDVSISSVLRWLENEDYPSLKVLISMSEEYDCNVAYLLDLTNVSAKIKTDNPRLLKKRLAPMATKELRAESADLTRILCAKPNLFKELLAEYPSKFLRRRKILLQLADILNVSIDYLLGLTDWPLWEYLYLFENPFFLCPPGASGYLTEIPFGEDAKPRAVSGAMELEGAVILRHQDGDTILLSNGETLLKDDPIFKDMIAIPCAGDADLQETFHEAMQKKVGKKKRNK